MNSTGIFAKRCEKTKESGRRKEAGTTKSWIDMAWVNRLGWILYGQTKTGRKGSEQTGYHARTRKRYYSNQRMKWNGRQRN